jgi:ammonia channel protein AmtB
LGVKNGPLSQLGAQVIDAGVGFLWAFGITFVIFIIAKRFMQIRVSPEVEIAGTDEGEFGQVCYPDFVLRAETHTGITTELDAGGGKTPSGAGVGSEPA